MRRSEEEIIRRWSAGAADDIRLQLLVTKDRRSENLSDFCDRLAELASQVSVQKKKLDAEDPPAIGILPNFRYHGVPEQKELEPFLEAVSLAAGGSDAGRKYPSDLDRVELPAELSLFVAPACAHCPAMFRRLAPLAAGSEKVRLSVVDAALFRESAEKENIRSVPTLVLDGKYRFSGVVPVADVLQMLVSREPADMSASVLLGLIEEGSAEQVAELMRSHRLVFPALIDLLTDEKWPRRLGAMVAMESVAETDPALAAEAVPRLLGRIENLSDAVKGDVVYLLGEIGGPNIAALLTRFTGEDVSSELAEAAAEALEKVNRK